MSKGVEGLFSSAATLSAPSRKSGQPKSDSQDSFEKVLQQVKPKPELTTESKKTDLAPKPAKSDEQPSDVSAEESQTSDEKPKANDSDDSQPSDVTTPTDEPKEPEKKPAKTEKSDEDAADSVDISALAAAQAVAGSITPDVAQAVEVAVATEEKPAPEGVTATTAKVAKPSPAAQATVTALAAKEPAPAAADQQDEQLDGDAPPPQQPAQIPATANAEAAPEEQPDVADTRNVAQQTPPPEPVGEAKVEQAKPAARRAQPAIADAVADQAAQAVADVPEASHAPANKSEGSTSASPTQIAAIGAAPLQAKPSTPDVQSTATQAPAPPPDADFAATNHEKIVSSVRTQLLPTGGTMRMRLDPPELGVLQVNVRMVDGAMTASFETSNDQATRLLSHSLGQLKQALETQGVSVERLHVEQAPRDQQNNPSGEDRDRNAPKDDQGARREQQRRETLNRMWRRLRLGRDPLDMVA